MRLWAHPTRRQIAVQCLGKEKFERGMAQKVAAKMRRSLRARAGHINFYRCKICGGYHIGSSIRPNR